MEGYNNNYPNESILNLFYTHGECNRIISRTCRVFNHRYPNLPPMNRFKFAKIETHFLRHWNMNTKRNCAMPVTGEENNEINILGYFTAHPHASIRKAEVDLDISMTSIQRVLAKNKWHPYAQRKVYELRNGDAQRRIDFCEWLTIRKQEHPDMLRKNLWSDESKFTRQGVLNNKNNGV
ncbi:transposable element tc3 transposase-like protein [Holotrichia oblita]|uniref:Transposable element tc3 transposase-like protein n=1 Tax=Holotrichia oblita TaxID=644536 RepID=A0ACB9TLV6_HOLOL|nr:transposable element tc3 transposase-like protein [Holotrichia oblita]